MSAVLFCFAWLLVVLMLSASSCIFCIYTPGSVVFFFLMNSLSFSYLLLQLSLCRILLFYMVLSLFLFLMRFKRLLFFCGTFPHIYHFCCSCVNSDSDKAFFFLLFLCDFQDFKILLSICLFIFPEVLFFVQYFFVCYVFIFFRTGVSPVVFLL